MKILKNKNGFSYIMVCVIVLIAMMLLSIGIQYRYMFYLVETQRDEVQTELDSLVMKSAIEYYDALKQGEVYGDYIDYVKLVEDAYKTLGFSSPGIQQIEGTGYTMMRPQIEAVEDGGFGITASYELSLTFEAFGRKVADIPVSVKIMSRFTEK